MIGYIVSTVALNEVRLRMRRLSTIVAVLVVVVISWLMIADPRGGNAMLSVGDARVLYTSAAMALGSASLGGMLFGLGGFYLVRGRIAEDLRSGTGSVIGATPAGNLLFIASRWLGGVAYLGLLVLAFMLTTMLCQLVRGDGPIEPMVYLTIYGLLLGPMVVFGVSCAILFDSIAVLMGKGGDVLYFFLWVAQLSLLSVLAQDLTHGPLPWPLMFDFSGITVAVHILQDLLNTTQLSIGSTPFNKDLAPVLLPALPWTAQTLGMRMASLALAVLPLLPAVLFFHRFSPDRVKAGKQRSGMPLLALANRLARPLARVAQPMFGMAARLPRLPGQVLAELALCFVAAPVTLAVIVFMQAAPWLADARSLDALLLLGLSWWGVLVANLPTRDYEADVQDMLNSGHGGAMQRYTRHLLATFVLGLLFTGGVAFQWPLERALILVGGMASMSALAVFMGRSTNTMRTFLALFLLLVFVMSQEKTIPYIDVVAANHAGNWFSALTHLGIGLVATAAGYVWTRRQ